MAHDIEEAGHRLNGAIKRLIHTPKGSEAEEAAASDALAQAGQVIDGVATWLQR